MAMNRIRFDQPPAAFSARAFSAFAIASNPRRMNLPNSKTTSGVSNPLSVRVVAYKHRSSQGASSRCIRLATGRNRWPNSVPHTKVRGGSTNSIRSNCFSFSGPSATCKLTGEPTFQSVTMRVVKGFHSPYLSVAASTSHTRSIGASISTGSEPVKSLNTCARRGLGFSDRAGCPALAGAVAVAPHALPLGPQPFRAICQLTALWGRGRNY